MKTLRKIICTILCFFSAFIFAQDQISKILSGYQISIDKTSEKIKIDGVLDEEAWQKAVPATSFWKKFPTDRTKALSNTEAKVCFDDEFLYIGFRAEDDGNRTIRTLKRDFGHDGQDGVGVIIDPYGTKTNGFFFTVNVFNAQTEDILKANSDKLDFSWDTRWYSEVKRYDKYYTVEFAIPFSSLRYNSNVKEWHINFMRVDIKNNEYSAWTPIPVNFKSHDLGYAGTMNWSQNPPKSKKNIDVFPYLLGSISKDNEAKGKYDSNFNAGFDAKIAVNSSLNLDLTVNPDFSQVDVDKQVTNLTRFNIFFPERRTFFLENSDLFSEYGIPPVRPFYSRKIGLDDNLQPIPIYFGARLSGNILPKTRISVMNIQTGKKNDYAGENYSAVSISQQVLKRSTIKAYFLNRNAFIDKAQELKNPLQKYGRDAGIEFLYNNESGNWQSWFGANFSMKPTIKDKNAFFTFGGGYFGRKITSFVDFGSLGTNYYADMGFLQRIENYDAITGETIRMGYKQVYNENSYTFFPKNKSLSQIKIALENFLVLTPDYKFNETENRLSADFFNKNSSQLGLSVSYNGVDLLFPTKFASGNPLPKDIYQNYNLNTKYNSDSRKSFNYKLGAGFGKFYGGTKTELYTGLFYRIQPKFNFGIDANYYKLNFPNPYGKAELFLLAPKVEYSFSNKLFWTNFLQYNTQRNNVNLSSRLQWRFKPMCDIFLVFSDNYFTSPFMQNKNRAVVFKINYLFGI